jgi:hypothetical protein
VACGLFGYLHLPTIGRFNFLADGILRHLIRIMSNAHATHKLLFEILTRRKLNELLHRADENTNYLQDQVNERLQAVGSELTATSEVYKNDNKECSIYIKYYKNDNEIGHITFHLMPELKQNGKANTFGRLHSRNTRNKTVRQVMHINRLNEDSMRIKLVAYHSFTTGSLRQAIDTTIELLNEYFYKDSPNFLGIHIMDSIEKKSHPCFSIIEKQFQQQQYKVKRLRNTRKQNR